MRHVPWLTGVGTLLAMSACGDPNSGEYGWLDVPEVRLQEDLRIDGYEADLVPITAALVSPSGTIALILWQDCLVRFFDTSGQELGSFGGQGEGPGEFMRPVRGGWVGDTLWVSDTQLGRVTWISPELELVRTALHPTRIRAPVGGDGPTRTYGQSFPYAIYPGDTALVSVLSVVDGPPPGPEEPPVLLRVAVAGGPAQEVTTTPSLQGVSVGVEYAEGSWAYGTIPFYPRPQWRPAADGSRIVTLTTDLTDPDSATFRVRVVDATGNEVFGRAFAFDPEPIPGAVMDSAIEAAVSRREGSLRTRIADRLHEEAPDFYPAVGGVRVGSDGRVWVELRARAGGHPWLILDPVGEPQGRITLPANVTLETADATHVYGTERDEMDVQSLVRYRLVGGADRAPET